MNEEAVIRQIGNMDAAEVKTKLHAVHQMQDYLNAIRSGEIQAHKEWVNSQLIFPEDFTEEMNKLSSDLHPIEKLLKQTDRIEAALNNQLQKLKVNK
jgi:chemotaxis protein histidine kinase CheA